MAVRDAPSDRRTAISGPRWAARPSSTAAMFVQAIRSSTETAPKSTHSDARISPTVVSLSGVTATPIVRSVSGNCSPSLA